MTFLTFSFIRLLPWLTVWLRTSTTPMGCPGISGRSKPVISTDSYDVTDARTLALRPHSNTKVQTSVTPHSTLERSQASAQHLSSVTRKLWSIQSISPSQCRRSSPSGLTSVTAGPRIAYSFLSCSPLGRDQGSKPCNIHYSSAVYSSFLHRDLSLILSLSGNYGSWEEMPERTGEAEVSV